MLVGPDLPTEGSVWDCSPCCGLPEGCLSGRVVAAGCKTCVKSRNSLCAVRLLGSWNHLQALIHWPSEEGMSVLFVLQNWVKVRKCLLWLPCEFVNSSPFGLSVVKTENEDVIRSWFYTVSIKGKRRTYYRQAHVYLALSSSCFCTLFCCTVLAVVPKFTWVMESGGMWCWWGYHPVDGCHPGGEDFLCLNWCQPQQVGSCPCFAGNLHLPGHPEHPWVKLLDAKQCTCLGKNNASPIIPAQEVGWEMFVLMENCKTEWVWTWFAFFREGESFILPNVRNIKDVFRQWEKKDSVWLTESVEQERLCFVPGYYDLKPVAACRGSTVQQAHS